MTIRPLGAILDEFYGLPDHPGDGYESLLTRLGCGQHRRDQAGRLGPDESPRPGARSIEPGLSPVEAGGDLPGSGHGDRNGHGGDAVLPAQVGPPGDIHFHHRTALATKLLGQRSGSRCTRGG